MADEEIKQRIKAKPQIQAENIQDGDVLLIEHAVGTMDDSDKSLRMDEAKKFYTAGLVNKNDIVDKVEKDNMNPVTSNAVSQVLSNEFPPNTTIFEWLKNAQAGSSAEIVIPNYPSDAPTQDEYSLLVSGHGERKTVIAFQYLGKRIFYRHLLRDDTQWRDAWQELVSKKTETKTLISDNNGILPLGIFGKDKNIVSVISNNSAWEVTLPYYSPNGQWYCILYNYLGGRHTSGGVTFNNVEITYI